MYPKTCTIFIFECYFSYVCHVYCFCSVFQDDKHNFERGESIPMMSDPGVCLSHPMIFVINRGPIRLVDEK